MGHKGSLEWGPKESLVVDLIEGKLHNSNSCSHIFKQKITY